jgi:hypothetical protein
MDLNIIRSGIFFVAGLVCIIFRKKLNNFKNKMLEKFNMKSRIKDERKTYIYMGILFIIISIILFLFAYAY